MRKTKLKYIVMAYPVVLACVAGLVGFFLAPPGQESFGLPTIDFLKVWSAAGIILLVNHTWLMNGTELVRAQFSLHANPEEREAAGAALTPESAEGLAEVSRYQRAHRNTTENVLYFGLLTPAFALTSPTTASAAVLLLGFSISRFGYTFAYTRKMTGLRGFFMSTSLVFLYSIAAYLLFVLWG